MMTVSKLLGRWGAGCGLVLAVLGLAGCGMGSHKPEFAEIPGLTPPANGTAMASTAGTATAPESASKTNEDLNIHILQPQDAVLITFSDLPTPWMPLSDRIKEDGTVTLPLNQTIHAAGRTTSALQEEIRGHYVPKYFVNMTVVVTLQEEKRFYYVDGEVKMPSRQVWMGPTTVLKAIASANGFTDFARKGSVVLTRANGSKMTINCRRAISHPELDMPVYPNDKIWVPRRIF